MLNLRFFLDDIEVDMPENFERVAMLIKRDDRYHGIDFEASLSSLTFTGAGMRYILQKKKEKGLKASIVFLAESRCDDDAEWEEVLTGKLDMAAVEESLGTTCSVSVPIERQGCQMMLRNRMNQKVDLDSLVAFDKITALASYPQAGFDIEIPGKEIAVGTEGSVAEENDFVGQDLFTEAASVETYVRPTYSRSVNESLRTSQLVPSINAASNDGFGDSVISPVVLIEEMAGVNCFSGLMSYEVRLKGNAYFQVGGVLPFAKIEVYVVKGVLPDIENPFESFSGMSILHNAVIQDTTVQEIFNVNFDQTFTGTTMLAPGEGFWAFVKTLQSGRDPQPHFGIRFDPETLIRISATMLCPPSSAKVYMVNEMLSRVSEAITNGCIRVRSDYYGRTDSKPYAAKADGCGSLRALNSGLQLRNAQLQPQDPVPAKCFASLEDLIRGLWPIDNIGFCVEPDPDRQGYEQLRIEGVEHFYQNSEMLSHPMVPEVKIKVEERGYYSVIRVGYQKWEVENVKGLDEVNATREFRTSLDAIDNPLDITSQLVAGSYPIEVTRQQSFATTGGADTKFDNDLFIYCLQRALYGFTVEQGGITGPEGVYSPSTVFNWRIRPFYNLMRWFKSIGSSYVNFTDTDNKLFFTSGTGNYVATGEQTSTRCKLENGAKAENRDLAYTDFLHPDEATPIWKPENISYKYPMSIAEYKRVKAAPYGFVSFQCGAGEWLKGYIKTIQFYPSEGRAEFNLKMKWE